MAKRKKEKSIWNGPEGSIQGEWITFDEMKAKRPADPLPGTQEKKLRAAGWMTTAEFIDKFNRGLMTYLENYTYTKMDDIHHPEDLISNVLSFAEITYIHIQNFGSGETNG